MRARGIRARERARLERLVLDLAAGVAGAARLAALLDGGPAYEVAFGHDGAEFGALICTRDGATHTGGGQTPDAALAAAAAAMRHAPAP